MAPITLKIKGKNFMPFFEMDTEDELQKTWRVCTRVKDSLENGSRLENLSWRLWHLHYKQKRDVIYKNKSIAAVLASKFDPIPELAGDRRKKPQTAAATSEGAPVPADAAATLAAAGKSTAAVPPQSVPVPAAINPQTSAVVRMIPIA